MELISGLFSFALSYALMPFVIALSWKIGAVDIPCDGRRMHCVSIPRNGGMAIFFTFLMGCVLFVRQDAALARAVAGGTLLFLVGLADDIYCLKVWVKFVGQLASAVIGCGFFPFSFGGILAVLWVVSLTNAHNFIDGIDGLFAGCSAIEGTLLAATFLLAGNQTGAICAILLGAACLGFRIYNRYPAQVFAGDCGSATVGYLFAVLSLPLFSQLQWGGGWLTPFFLFAYPLTDLITAVVRRVLRGRSPFYADRGHLHHRICALGLTQVQCGGVLMLITAGVGLVGMLMCTEQYAEFACIASVLAALTLVRIRHYIMGFQ